MRKVYPYTLLDVFTDQMFGGNQLAVFTQAEGLSDEQMQKIANEMNLSETTFVTAGHDSDKPRVRIFTTSDEMPFAGHPTIGTAICLAHLNHQDGDEACSHWTLIEQVGPVPVTVDRSLPVAKAEFTTAVLPSLKRSALNKAQAARLLNIEQEKIFSAAMVGDCGAPFTLIELTDKAAVDAVQIQASLKELFYADSDWPAFYLFSRDDNHLYARMICQEVNLVEDAATGSAAAAVSGYLAQSLESGHYHFYIEQGVQIGRPSQIELGITIGEGLCGQSGVTKVTVAGQAVIVGEGYLLL
ncbi:PhzF family phenazine biosynthesis protein [Oceanospirillum beijerinckii]|uniref:PhzF family phenazine biosynthesis protein n=1 Tax=Oceanospirillum beijerinckii TaxID=64976 RepID=UPI000423253C|nr:PhzF family phenazine biosynthesis protein [Oceanospirillum beijerinckii]